MTAGASGAAVRDGPPAARSGEHAAYTRRRTLLEIPMVEPEDPDASFVGFLKKNWLWWTLPILLVLALLAWLAYTDPGTPEPDSPFQYDLY